MSAIVTRAGDSPPDQSLHPVRTPQNIVRTRPDVGNAVLRTGGGRRAHSAAQKDHILIAAGIVTATKAGDNAKVASENASWKTNPSDIATSSARQATLRPAGRADALVRPL
jgi:hypothetical protein